ncbi:MAG: Coenzyme F420 hydrogenase/dehydrogenase, beta subunit C-terminal domain [Oscillospiraceae bacterium]|nr:Coenzyme F420 hydrogenase/dehydrogenase, beta subunit C-terminal domain [Oscillospiraceae bacterium]
MQITKDKCTGCGACADICPAAAIAMEHDDEGFLYPLAGEGCTDCGLCGKVCPELRPLTLRDMPDEVFAVWHNDDSERLAASSGGFFRILAKTVIKGGGAVIGAAFDENFTLRHGVARDWEGCKPFSGSKYLQSNTEGIYKETAALLNSGVKVLFSGTPCQVAGLHKFLGGARGGLYTCDIICSGVPSPGVFGKYLKGLEHRFGAKAESVNFRDKSGKRPRFTVKFANGKTYSKELYDTDFGYGFGAGLFLRRSCGNCRYADGKRAADFTLGDFWGLEIPHDARKGVSLVMVNTEKGRNMMEKLPPEYTIAPRPLSEAVAGNPRLIKPPAHNPKRDEFFGAYSGSTLEKALGAVGMGKVRRVVGKIKRRVRG